MQARLWSEGRLQGRLRRSQEIKSASNETNWTNLNRMILIKICIPQIESFNKCQRAKTITALALALAGDRAELVTIPPVLILTRPLICLATEHSQQIIFGNRK